MKPCCSLCHWTNPAARCRILRERGRDALKFYVFAILYLPVLTQSGAARCEKQIPF